MCRARERIRAAAANHSTLKGVLGRESRSGLG